MHRPIHVVSSVLLFAPVGLTQETGSRLTEPPGLQAIQAQDLKTWTTFLASDELNGRLTGSPGQEKAADYIAKHFESLGLEKLGDRKRLSRVRNYKSRYRVSRFSLDPKGRGIVLGEGEAARVFDKGFAVIPKRGGVVKPRPKVVIVDPGDAKKYQVETEPVADEGAFVYAGLVGQRRFRKGVQLEDWKGKIPVFVVKAPKLPKGASIQQEMSSVFFLSVGLKRRADRLAKLGAKLAVFCILDNDSGMTTMLTYGGVGPGQDLLRKDGAQGQSDMLRMMMTAKVPLVFLGRKLSLGLLDSIGLDEKAAMSAQDEAAVAKLKTPKGAVDLVVKYDPLARASNVCALLRGKDEIKRAQAIVYSAHMDHVGIRLDGDPYNGADDNASGTAGLMAIAKAYASLPAKERPDRSIIFLAVSGEELGLWGSAHWANEPSWSIVDVVANINTDMIGRSGPESGPMEITVTPSHRHRKFSTIVRDSARVAEHMGITLRRGDKYYERSDHLNFAKKGIPVVFFCNGEHEDYHKVTDHPELLDPQKMQRIARLAYWTGYRVASAEGRPVELGRKPAWLEKPGEASGNERRK